MQISTFAPRNAHADEATSSEIPVIAETTTDDVRDPLALIGEAEDPAAEGEAGSEVLNMPLSEGHAPSR